MILKATISRFLKVGTMSMIIEKKFKDLMGIEIPIPSKVIGSYVPSVIADNFLYISGSLPTKNGDIISHGKVEYDVTREQAISCAKLCGINILSVAKQALGDLDRIEKLVRANIYINSDKDFYFHPTIANGF